MRVFSFPALFISVLFTFLSSQEIFSQTLRAFPITGYMVDLNDSVKIVQVVPGPGIKIAEKQVGVLTGIYRTSSTDTTEIGTGRCNLIKGEYYYFSIQYKKSGQHPREGDLLYVLLPQTQAPVYNSRLVKLSAHFIDFQHSGIRSLEFT